MAERGLSLVLRAKDELSPALKDVSTGLGTLESKGAAFGNAIKVGALAAVGGITALAGGLTLALKSASDVNESFSKMQTVFGDASGEIDAWSRTAAQSLGLSRGAALDAAGSFGNMFGQIGIASDATADMSKGLIGLASDMASFHNADITEVIAAQTSAFRGEFDALQRFVPTINAAAVQQEAMAMTGKKNASALTDQEKAMATYKLIMEGAGAATGDFQRTSTGMANSLRIVNASFEDAKVAIGERLLPVIAPLIADFAKNLPAALDTLSVALDGVQAFIERFKEDGLGTLKEFGSQLGAQLMEWGQAFLEWVAPLIPPMLDKLRELGDWIVFWIKSYGPSLLYNLEHQWIPAFVGWLGPAVGQLIQKLAEELPGFLAAMARWVSTTAVPAFVNFGLTLGGAIVRGVLTGLAGLGASIIGSINQNVGDPLRAAAGNISTLQSAGPDPTFGFGGGVRNAAGARQAAQLQASSGDISAGERRRRARKQMGRLGIPVTDEFGVNEFIDALRNLTVRMDGRDVGKLVGFRQQDDSLLLSRFGAY